MSTSVTLRPVTDGDDAFLLELYASTRDDVLRSPLSAEEKAQFVAMQCRAQRVDYETRFRGSDHSIVLVDGVPHGRIWVDRRADEIRLLDIALVPHGQNRGTGRALLERLIVEADRSATPLRHSVLLENEAALRFYERLDFEIVENFGLHVLMEHRPGADVTHD